MDRKVKHISDCTISFRKIKFSANDNNFELWTPYFKDKMSMVLGEWNIDIIHAPGETDDQINVFVKEIGLLLPGDFSFSSFFFTQTLK